MKRAFWISLFLLVGCGVAAGYVSAEIPDSGSTCDSGDLCDVDATTGVDVSTEDVLESDTPISIMDSGRDSARDSGVVGDGDAGLVDKEDGHTVDASCHDNDCCQDQFKCCLKRCEDEYECREHCQEAFQDCKDH